MKTSEFPAVQEAKKVVQGLMGYYKSMMDDAPQNIRHDIDRTKVQEQIEKKILSYETRRAQLIQEATERQVRYEQDSMNSLGHRWRRAPDTPEELSSWIDDMIERERSVYSKVRVLELPVPAPRKRFILVYGEVHDDLEALEGNGTGPFSTFEDASQWFLKGGR